VVQRRIAVNTAGQPQNDYAIMKQVQQLRKAHRGEVVMLRDDVDFSDMAAGEKLFIVSHGDAATGDLRDLPVATLLRYLNHPARGVRPSFGGITILSCYAGEAVQNQSLAQRVAAGLTRVGGGKTVQGPVGFSFGSPEFLATQKSSVLASNLRPFYAADDINQMKADWAQRLPTHNGGVLKSLAGFNADTNLSIRTNIIQRGGKTPARADELIDTYIRRYKSEVKRIEMSLKELLVQVPGTSISEKLASFEERSGANARIAARWDKRIQQQYRLFHDYYLWSPAAGSFASFTT
jgi:hypothetical protein